MGKAITNLNKPNNNLYFLPINDAANPSWVQKLLPIKITLAIEEGAAMGIEISGNTTTGYITTYANENANGGDFVGILAEPITALDTDYSIAGKLKSVWVPTTPLAEAEFAVASGTLDNVEVYKTFEVATGGLGLSCDTAGKGARVIRKISSSRGVCTFPFGASETA